MKEVLVYIRNQKEFYKTIKVPVFFTEKMIDRYLNLKFGKTGWYDKAIKDKA